MTRDTSLTNPGQPLDWKEIAVVVVMFLAIAYFYLGADIFQGEIVAPMDILLDGEGWKDSGFSIPITDRLRGDILDAWLPRWIFVKEQLAEGQVPLWNPLVAGGQPAVPLLQDSYLTPGFLLFCIFEDGIGFTLGLLIRLVLAGTGAYFLCRLALGRLASLFAGLTFMMCGFNSSWLMWPQVATSAWIPWVLWGSLRLLQSPSIFRMSLVSLLTIAMLFGGFPAVAAYGLILLGFIVLWWVWNNLRRAGIWFTLRSSLWLLGALFLSLMLGAIQLLPFLEYLEHVDLSWREGWSIPFAKIPLLLVPFRDGQPNPEHCGYVGVLAMLFGVFAVYWGLRSRDLKGFFSPLCWLAAVVLTLMIVYGQPAVLFALLRKLPVLNFNQNGRMLSLYGLEMSVLAAIGLQSLVKVASDRSRRKGPKTLVTGGLILMMGLFLFHFLDLQRLGRAQNAIVPQQSFFPQTSLIREVRENLLTGQSVVHTFEAFRYPGVLTAYGLKDWFAHTHRMKGEKELLEQLVEDPWTGPTAAILFPNQIQFDSPYFDIFSIRYVLVASPTVTGHSRPDGHVILAPGQKIQQSFRLEESALVSGVQVLTAAYGPGTDPDSGLLVKLKSFDGRIIAEQQAPKDRIGHHRWTTLLFDSEEELDSGYYLLQFEAIGSQQKPLVIGASPNADHYRAGSLTDDSGRDSGDLAFRLLGNRASNMQFWKTSHLGEPVVLYENRNVPPGGFLVSMEKDSQDEDLSEIFWSGLRLLNSTGDRIDYEVNCSVDCWQIRSARIWPGWSVFVDETERPVECFLGLLPGVKVPVGRHVVSWRYVPRYWAYGWKISLSALLFLAILNISAMSKSGKSGSERR